MGKGETGRGARVVRKRRKYFNANAYKYFCLCTLFNSLPPRSCYDGILHGFGLAKLLVLIRGLPTEGSVIPRALFGCPQAEYGRIYGINHDSDAVILPKIPVIKYGKEWGSLNEVYL